MLHVFYTYPPSLSCLYIFLAVAYKGYMFYILTLSLVNFLSSL